jgi:hypothetical protein
MLGHLLLGEAEHDPPLTDAEADIVVDIEGTTAAAGAASDNLAGHLRH